MSDIHLVIGGAGFIGSNVVHQLVQDGMSVRVFDDFSAGREENLAPVKEQIDIIRGDIRDLGALQKAMEGIRYVFHFGSLASVQASVENPLFTHDVNLTGTLNVLLAARDQNVDRVMFSSSSSVYGDSPEMPKRENMLVTPLSGYALSKLAGEHYCRIFHSLYGLKTYALRYFNVFGPRQDPQSHYAAVIPLFMQAYFEGRQPIIYGDGEQTRDFTFVGDVVAANLLCRTAPSGAAGRVYNIAYGECFTINELAAQIAGLTGCEFAPTYLPARKGDIRDSQADPALAQHALKWSPQYSFEEGLQITYEWYKTVLGR